jgi:hypothetical protein
VIHWRARRGGALVARIGCRQCGGDASHCTLRAHGCEQSVVAHQVGARARHLGNRSCVAHPSASLQSRAARRAIKSSGSNRPLPASDRHGWRECRGLSGTIPACLPRHSYVHVRHTWVEAIAEWVLERVDHQPIAAGHGPGDHIEHPREHVWTRREQQSQRPRERQDPLTDRYAREHMVDQVRGRFHHASCTARRTEAAATAAEGHQMLMAALAALDPQESMFEPSAAKVRLDYLEISSCLRETAVERFQFSHLDRKFRQAFIKLASAR